MRRLAFETVQIAITCAEERVRQKDKEKKYKEYLRGFAKSTVYNVYDLVRQRLKVGVD